MQKSGDPPGTKQNAQSRLTDEKTGKYVRDPTKVSTTRRASGKRSVSASTPRDERSRSPEHLSDPENQKFDRPGIRSTFPNSASTEDVRYRLPRKTTLDDFPKAVERLEYERVQAQLRQ
eukprot:5542254-Amphidinium_carterae.1